MAFSHPYQANAPHNIDPYMTSTLRESCSLTFPTSTEAYQLLSSSAVRHLQSISFRHWTFRLGVIFSTEDENEPPAAQGNSA
jgi:hypothetical protein